MKHYPQIVKVIDAAMLLDGEGRKHGYRTEAGRRLGIGYQVVTWPDELDTPRFDEHARFIGPFRTYGHARLAMERQVDLLAPLRRSA